ncbi:hypothetical protein MBLNU230_g1771t1 [Neophaeotheca triangularis]
MSYNGNYYDPVGSQSNQQPRGYRYQTPAGSTSAYPSSTTAASYQASNYRGYANTADYSNPQPAQGNNNPQARASAALNNLTTDYNQPQSNTSANAFNQYSRSNSSWNDSMYPSSSYGSAVPQAKASNRAQSNASPIYASNNNAPGASTLGRLSYSTDPAPATTMNDPSHYPSHSYASQSGTTAPAQTYQQGYAQAGQQSQPPRYNSPLQAVQAQQQQRGHARQPSRSSEAQPPPQLNSRPVQQSTQQRHQSMSVGPSNTTVDPSQVYDFRAEQQRKAQIEAEKRRKTEEAEAARKAEEERVAAVKKAEEDRATAAKKAEEDRVVAERAETERKEREAREAAAFEEAVAKKKAEATAKAEKKRLAREEKKQSKTAATALQKMASSGGEPSAFVPAAPPAAAEEPAPPVDEEAEMRAMFQKMREYNQKNPAMLARLWDEERKMHNPQSPPQTRNAEPARPANPRARQSSTNAVSPNTASHGMPTPAQNDRPGATAPQPASKKGQSQRAPPPLPPMVWAPGRKGYVAEHATKWVLSQPGNIGKKLSSDFVVRLLDANPSYVQLCEALEATTLTIDRAAFARELLKAVPHVFSAKKSAAAPSNQGPPRQGTAQGAARGDAAVDLTSPPPERQQKTTVAYETPRCSAVPRISSLRDAANEVNNMSAAPQQPVTSLSTYTGPGPSSGHQSPYFAQPTGVSNGSRPPSQSQPPPQVSEPPPKKPPSPPPRPPANKEEAARKRTFGDLVDLTMGDSDEEAPPKKIPQTAANMASTGRPVAHQQAQVDRTWSSGIDKAFAPILHGDTKGLQPGRGPIHPSGPSVHRVGSAQASLEEQRRLAGIPDHLKFVTTATSETPPAKMSQRPKGPSLETVQKERIKGKLLVEPIMRDRVARRSTYDHRTIARDVLLATGRHPDMRGLNGHLSTMQKMLGEQGGMFDSGNRADLATIRWDVLDPDPPKPAAIQSREIKHKGAKPAEESIVPAVNDATLDGEDADDEGDFVVPSPKALSRQQPAKDMSHAPKAQAQAPPSTFPLGLTKAGKPRKRPGRKPRAHLAANTINASVKGRTSPSVRVNSTPRQTRDHSTPASAPANASASVMAPSGTPVGYAQFRQLDADGNAVKKKGRPVGWRKDVHSRQAAGLTPAQPGGHGPASSGPRSKRTSTNKEASVPEPHYEIYNCEWQGCEAELHNLDVLKKHVLKVHGKPSEEDVFECLWTDCHHSTKHINRQGKASSTSPASFKDVSEWLKHIDRAHLLAVAWKLGDGPRGGLSETHDSEGPYGSEAYLSDANGRSATPVLRANIDPNGQGASQTLPSRGFKAKKDPRAAEAELKELKSSLKAVGYELGSQGSKVVNGSSILGFLDDENFYDVVEVRGESSSEEDENESGNEMEEMEVE